MTALTYSFFFLSLEEWLIEFEHHSVQKIIRTRTSFTHLISSYSETKSVILESSWSYTLTLYKGVVFILYVDHISKNLNAIFCFFFFQPKRLVFSKSCLVLHLEQFRNKWVFEISNLRQCIYTLILFFFYLNLFESKFGDEPLK